MTHFYILLGAIFIFNFVVLFFRRSKVRRFAKKATDERLFAEKRLEEVKRNIESEQIRAEQYIKRQNRTLDLYEQVRRQPVENRSESGGHDVENVEHDDTPPPEE